VTAHYTGRVADGPSLTVALIVEAFNFTVGVAGHKRMGRRFADEGGRESFVEISQNMVTVP
jgi:hypothetical protein